MEKFISFFSLSKEGKVFNEAGSKRGKKFDGKTKRKI
jgi:hypothetical protein